MQDTIYISGLEPLIAPEKVASWPPAPGWYVLAGLLLLALILLILSWIRKRRENRYRIIAMHGLKEIIASSGNHPGQGDLQSLNRLLKETALTVFPREQVAALFGNEWLEFLDQSCNKTDFTGLSGNLLGTASYSGNKEVNIPQDQWNQLIEVSETWIRKHRRKL